MAAATPTDVWCQIHSFLTSQAIMSAHKLGVFDYLEGKDGLCITDVSTALGSHVHATKQLLDFMVCLGYLGTKKEATDASIASSEDGDLYFNTEITSKYLTTNSPLTLLPILTRTRDLSYSTATDLLSVVTKGADFFDTNIKGKDHWAKTVDANTETGFLCSMKSYCQVWQIPAVLNSFDLSPFTSVCDLGGGTGDVAYAVAEKYPHMQVTMFDLPHIVELAERKGSDSIPSNVSLKGGDFFTDDLPKVDLYILSNIIHDWPDHKADTILSNVYKAVNPDGAILVVELFLDKGDEPGNIHGHMLNMLMLYKVFGRQLSGKHMSDLLTKHGFVDIQIKKNPHSMANCLLAKKLDKTD